jgi:translation initiation factor IF-3
MDYGKHQYEKKKRQKHAAGGHVIVLKEIRLRPTTDEHDRAVKMKRAKAFLGEGCKVQFTMLFRGRERAHRDRAIQAFQAIIEELGETVKVERFPAMEGRRMTMVVTPVKPTKKQPASAPASTETTPG